MKNKQNDKEWELGGENKFTRTDFCDNSCKDGKQQKKNKQSHKNEWEVKNKNKNHVEGMRNEEKKQIAIMGVRAKSLLGPN